MLASKSKSQRECCFCDASILISRVRFSLSMKPDLEPSLTGISSTRKERAIIVKFFPPRQALELGRYYSWTMLVIDLSVTWLFTITI